MFWWLTSLFVPLFPDGIPGTDDCIPTIGDMLTAVNAEGGSGASTTVQPGVDINSLNTSGIAAALAAVQVGSR